MKPADAETPADLLKVLAENVTQLRAQQEESPSPIGKEILEIAEATYSGCASTMGIPDTSCVRVRLLAEGEAKLLQLAIDNLGNSREERGMKASLRADLKKIKKAVDTLRSGMN